MVAKPTYRKSVNKAGENGYHIKVGNVDIYIWPGRIFIIGAKADDRANTGMSCVCSMDTVFSLDKLG